MYEKNSPSQKQKSLRCSKYESSMSNWILSELITRKPPYIGWPNSFMCFLGILYLLEVSAYTLCCKIFTIPIKRKQYVILRRLINLNKKIKIFKVGTAGE